ncbi:hypothetical protein J6A34_03905 [bacterium]|nr:hypothetical protein [bacterium]
MKEIFKPTTDERPIMIVMGILALYLLIVGFILYLFLLHRITLLPTIIGVITFTLIYLPRLLIIKKLAHKDIIKIVDNGININNQLIPFSQIQDFRVEEKKPAVVFFMNNSMVCYYEAKFHLKLNNGQISFSAIGSEKIQLLKEFLTQLLNN